MAQKKVGYGAGSVVIEVNEDEFIDIESEIQLVIEDLSEIQEILYKHLANITEMQSKYLDTFCEESDIVVNELDNIYEIILNFMTNNGNICSSFIEADMKLKNSL